MLCVVRAGPESIRGWSQVRILAGPVFDRSVAQSEDCRAVSLAKADLLYLARFRSELPLGQFPIFVADCRLHV
jgi:hypothetical protein